MPTERRNHERLANVGIVAPRLTIATAAVAARHASGYPSCRPARPFGGVAERSNAAVSKTVSGGFVRRGFKSLPLRLTKPQTRLSQALFDWSGVRSPLSFSG
jgi:hypothetical protein